MMIRPTPKLFVQGIATVGQVVQVCICPSPRSSKQKGKRNTTVPSRIAAFASVLCLDPNSILEDLAFVYAAVLVVLDENPISSGGVGLGTFAAVGFP